MQFIASLSHELDVDVVKEKQGRERKKMHRRHRERQLKTTERLHWKKGQLKNWLFKK